MSFDADGKPVWGDDLDLGSDSAEDNAEEAYDPSEPVKKKRKTSKEEKSKKKKKKGKGKAEADVAGEAVDGVEDAMDVDDLADTLGAEQQAHLAQDLEEYHKLDFEDVVGSTWRQSDVHYTNDGSRSEISLHASITLQSRHRKTTSHRQRSSWRPIKSSIHTPACENSLLIVRATPNKAARRSDCASCGQPWANVNGAKTCLAKMAKSI